MAVVPGERLDERGGISTPGKRQGGKVEAGGPALGASVQQSNIRVGQVQPRTSFSSRSASLARNVSRRFALRQGRRWP